MFDRLVESTRQKQGGRTGRVFVATGLLYGIGMLGLGVGAILSFSPALAEEYSLVARLAPPPPPPGPPAIPLAHAKAAPVQTQFAPPTKPPVEILPADLAAKLRPVVTRGPFVDGMPPGTGSGADGGVIGGKESNDPPPPPVPEKKETAAQAIPEVKPKTPQRVSEGVLAGKAVHREKPAYPAMARVARAGGPVAVQVTISEEGRVIDAVALSGHPLLRAAALAAARQWIFTPTRLSNVPVKVQGILTFNFTLQ
jgi:protein TonB